MTKLVAVVLGSAVALHSAGPVWAAGLEGDGNGPAVSTVGTAQTWRKPVFWSAVGGAVVAAGLGVFAVVQRNQSVDEFNSSVDASGQPLCNEIVPGYGGPACQSAHDQAGRWQTTALVALGSSLALTTAAAVLKLIEPDADNPALERVSLGWTPGGGATASYRLRF